MPPLDAGAGGSDYYDVYIDSIDLGSGGHTYGYVSPENVIGDNPQSSGSTETSAMSSWMVMNNDYTWVTTTTILNAIKVTAAHEFFHAVQFGTTADCTNWMSESSAAWSEDEIYPTIDDNLQYIGSVYDNPDVALNWNRNWDQGEGIYDQHWYGAWTFIRYMSEYTDSSIMQKSYHETIAHPMDIPAINSALATYFASDFGFEFEHYLVTNAYLSTNASNIPFLLLRDAVYSAYSSNNGGSGFAKVEGSINFSGTTTTYSSTTDGNSRLQRLSADYIDLSASQNFRVILTPNDVADDLDIIVTKRNASGVFSVVNSVGVGNTKVIDVMDASSFQDFKIIVKRYDSARQDSANAQYSLEVNGNPTAIKEVAVNNVSVNVYPNPSTNFIQIEATQLNANHNVEIADITGKIVFSEISTTEKSLINIKSLPSGTYFVNIKSQGKLIATKKISKI